jgi:peptidoglycan-associated lipoprotein
MAFACVAGLLLAAGCNKAPEQALDEASDAVQSAESKSECAKEKFAAAQRLLDEAKAHAKAGEYDKAERKAKAAERLAKEAREKAEANWEDCQKDLAKQRQPDEDQQTDESEQRDQSDQQDQEDLKLQTVHFGYDSAKLSEEARDNLQQNVEWLREHPDTPVVLQGHTDERGSIQYNLALGEQRARAVRQYLSQLGIDTSRLKILSYGEEKPVAHGNTKSAYRQNRRVEFVPQN